MTGKGFFFLLAGIALGGTAAWALNKMGGPTPGGGGAFTFGIPTATTFPSWSGSVFKAVRLVIPATNPNQSPMTHTLSLWAADQPNNIPAFQVKAVVSLNPGQTQTVVLDSSGNDTFAIGDTCKVWVQDENGIKSPIITVS